MNDLKIVFDFKHRCEIAFDQLTILSEANSKLNQPQTPFEINSILIDNTIPSFEVIENIPVAADIPLINDEVNIFREKTVFDPHYLIRFTNIYFISQRR